MSAETCSCDICTENFVDPRLSFFDNTHYKFMNKVGVRAVVTASRALFQGFLGIQRIEIGANGELLDLLGQTLVEIGHFLLDVGDDSLSAV